MFGSLTCPVTGSAGDGLRELHARYGDHVRFVLVNVREAHPGALTPQPTTVEQKLEHASLLREHHQLPFEVAADDIDGTLHRAFGPRPSSAYIIAPVTSEIERAVAAVANGEPPLRSAAGGTVRASAAMTGHAPTAFRMAGSTRSGPRTLLHLDSR